MYQVSDCSLGLENTSVVVEVTSFEPLQELLITWELKVLQSNYVVSGGLAPYPIDNSNQLVCIFATSPLTLARGQGNLSARPFLTF